ncbi:synaptonemal complex protein 2-like [Pholidichthys leucotaenia]
MLTVRRKQAPVYQLGIEVGPGLQERKSLITEDGGPATKRRKVQDRSAGEIDGTELCGCGFNRILVLLKSLELLSENRNDIQTLIDYGLTTKLLLWFDMLHDHLTSDLHKGSAPLCSLTEYFLDYFLLLAQVSLPVSELSVVLLHLVRFCLGTGVHFSLRLEAIRTFNSILESLGREQRRLIQNDQKHILILSEVAAAVLTVGDYELQVSLSEALCRLTPRKDREHRANRWFSSRDIIKAFCDIKDADFEVDCRRFLNFINSHHGNQRSVYTFPCLRAFLSTTQLFRPNDDKLEEFWIDFNVGSGSVSFFIDDPQGFLWASIHLLKEEVDHYSLELQHKESVLSVRLNQPIMHNSIRGQTMELCFSAESHSELKEATSRVFMEVQNSPHVKDPGDVVQAPPPNRRSHQSYSRKKPGSKTQLKILPLSSVSSEEDFSVSMAADRNTSEVLFDQIISSTPKTHHCFQNDLLDVNTSESHLSDAVEPVSGDHEEAALQNQSEDLEGSVSPVDQEVVRKRKAPDSGVL